jgi:hypothetical protein
MHISRRKRELQERGAKKLSRRERERLTELTNEENDNAESSVDEDDVSGDAVSDNKGELGSDVLRHAQESLSAECSDEMSGEPEDPSAEELDSLAIDLSLGTGGRGTWSKLYGEALPSWLVERLEVCGFAEPTPVQAQAIDTVLRDKRDALVQAYTGSGKTLSFLIPLFAFLEEGKSMHKQGRRLAGVQARKPKPPNPTPHARITHRTHVHAQQVLAAPRLTQRPGLVMLHTHTHHTHTHTHFTSPSLSLLHSLHTPLSLSLSLSPALSLSLSLTLRLSSLPPRASSRCSSRK